MSVHRIYVVKKKAYAIEALSLLNALKIEEKISSIEDIDILNRYDIEGIEDKLETVLHTVFSEPMVDDLYLEHYPFEKNTYFSVEYLSGQYDQRADSAEQCVKVITGLSDIRVKCAKTYVFKGIIKKKELDRIKEYIINNIDQRIASENKPETLVRHTSSPVDTPIIDNFINMSKDELLNLLSSMDLAMSIEDILYSQEYFKNEEKRCPTETELKLLDTYWSDHCRHTTFNTVIDNIEIEAGFYKELIENTLKMYLDMRKDIYGSKIEEKPVTLMDLAVIAAKDAKKNGFLTNLEESEENNACSIEIDVLVNGKKENWLLQFKNETHNHPTEIEPFGGAATCVGGAIRDPLSGRAYVYQAMRITGAADPRKALPKELKGKKLPQKKITKDAAKGFSSYGNQIGLTTGYVHEYYHSGFIAKRMEVGAVIGAVPKSAVRRETPLNNDLILLLGGKTGRDGVGGATGSSKEHDSVSIDVCSAEVQKGNPLEEHKLQRLFRNRSVSKMIKKCNDFGAGGISVAIGELADSLYINLNSMPKKYEGLTGTELALSESQERMAVVIDKNDLDEFLKHCKLENIEATVVARVTDTNRLQMEHNGKLIVDLSKKFLDSAGVIRHQSVVIANPVKTEYIIKRRNYSNFEELVINTLSDLNVCSQKGLVEMFDSTIGAASVLTPFGGKYGYTPVQAMAAKIPVLSGDTPTISIMAVGYNPYIMEWSSYHGAFYAVIESVAKVIALGGRLKDIRLSFQEYFERLGIDKYKWGKPFAALLGALKVQKELNLGAIGGKDSMSGTYKDDTSNIEINVPPTLISFAVAPSLVSKVITPEFNENEGDVYFLKTPIRSNDLIDLTEFRRNSETITRLIEENSLAAIYTIVSGGIIEAAAKMSFGNKQGINFVNVNLEELAFPYYGSYLLQAKKNVDLSNIRNIIKIGTLNVSHKLQFNKESISCVKALKAWQEPLEKIFPTKTVNGDNLIISPRDYRKKSSFAYSSSFVQPRVAVLALAGTNCEYDTKRIFEKAGSHEVEPFIFRNMTAFDINESCEQFANIINNSQILAIPGGFSAGDEPEGSGKFFVSVLKHKLIREAVDKLINKRDGLVIGICNGFQALIKTGLLTYSCITDVKEDDATLSFNKIGRHVSQMVRTRVASTNSPWMSYKLVGDIDIVSVSHGEGRFIAQDSLINKFFEQGQVLFQYVDIDGNITMESPYNPNFSTMAIEGICSPCGRVLGKMGHSERIGEYLHLNNRYGNMDQRIFEAGVKYFTGKE